MHRGKGESEKNESTQGTLECIIHPTIFILTQMIPINETLLIYLQLQLSPVIVVYNLIKTLDFSLRVSYPLC